MTVDELNKYHLKCKLVGKPTILININNADKMLLVDQVNEKENLLTYGEYKDQKPTVFYKHNMERLISKYEAAF